MTDAANLSTLTRSQRECFIDTLEGLPPEQWLAPSLCSEWRTIDVAAHLAGPRWWARAPEPWPWPGTASR